MIDSKRAVSWTEALELAIRLPACPIMVSNARRRPRAPAPNRDLDWRTASPPPGKPIAPVTAAGVAMQHTSGAASDRGIVRDENLLRGHGCATPVAPIYRHTGGDVVGSPTSADSRPLAIDTRDVAVPRCSEAKPVRAGRQAPTGRSKGLSNLFCAPAASRESWKTRMA